MDPVTIGMIGSSAIGGLAGIFGSRSAARAQEDAIKRADRANYRGTGIQLGLSEAERYAQWNALNDINTEFGYQSTPWASGSDLNEPTMDASAIIKALRSGMSFDEVNALGRLGVMNDKEMAKLTGYGLTPDQIKALTALPGGTTGGVPATGRGFMASPDYQFRRGEGMRGIEQGAAARGGALSGNALQALAQYNSGLASGEYDNWFNRRLALAGHGQQGTNRASNAIAQSTQNTQQNALAQGDARASGILGGVNSLSNAINVGMQNWLTADWLKKQPQAPVGPYYGGSYTGATRGYA